METEYKLRIRGSEDENFDLGDEIKVVEDIKRTTVLDSNLDVHDNFSLPSRWCDFDAEFLVQSKDQAGPSQQLRLIMEAIKRTLWLNSQATTEEHARAYDVLSEMCPEKTLWSAFEQLSRQAVIIKNKTQGTSRTGKFRRYVFSERFLRRVNQSVKGDILEESKA